MPNTVKLNKIVRAKASGAMPTDVMLKTMRFHYAIAEAEERKGKNADLELISLELNRAHAAATDVAPYYHSRLATLQTNMNVSGTLTLAQLLAQPIPAPANSNAVEDGDTKIGAM